MKGAFTAIRQFFKGLDKILLLICIAASTISCLTIYSFYKTGILPNNKYFKVQIVAIVLGIAVAFIVSLIDYRTMANLWRIYVPIAVILVGLTYIIGVGPEGADDKAWLDLGFTTIQPSEILKLAFIFTFALHLSKVGEKMNQLKPFLLLCLHGAVPTLMVALQGDFGSALVFMAIFIFMIFIAGLSLKLIFVGLVGGGITAPIVWFYVLQGYLKERFYVAQRPEDYLKDAAQGFQQYTGRISIGSGQLYGRGLFSGDLYNRVPEVYNDFIFSHIGQTMGFVGTTITLLIIALICVKILSVAKASKDKLGRYICVGVFSIFLFQSIINIGMVLCVLPVIGITLPFISSGGTSVLVSYISIGMVMSVHRANKKELMFD